MKSMASSGFDSLYQVFAFTPSYEEITNCKEIMDLINTTSKYDLVVTETFNTDFFTLLGWFFKAPVVAFQPNAPFPWMADFKGLPYNPSYIPHFMTGFATKMDFYQRVENVLLNVYSLYAYHVNSYVVYDEMAKRIFGPDVPSLDEVAKNASVLFLNTHFSMNCVRPMVPNVVEVAGLNIKKAKPLDKVNNVFVLKTF